MVTQSGWIYLIPCYPLVAFLLNVFFGAKVLKEKAAWVSIAASVLSFFTALPFTAGCLQGKIYSDRFPWIAAGNGSLDFGYLIDPMAAVLIFVVTLVGTLIVVYSTGYMRSDAGYHRFFAYVSLFMSAMTTLVIANNFLLFFIAWEIMGLCSYLLIGFWFEKPAAAKACKKAFLVTRVGDIGLFLGILTLFTLFGTLHFEDIKDMAQTAAGNPLLPAAAFLVFCGTIGKSAQFPLHVWLPDAMEGPTPVSALIHAATMVAAGVYLLARAFPVLALSPDVMKIILYTGTGTAFVGAFIALGATDIKKVLAYSTISQLGFMVAAMGLGAVNAGFFHLVTHAFFKALLFMGAGSVIHGTGTQDLRELGGLFPKMKSTAWTFLIGALAISGIPPLAGFWSKDEILTASHGNNFIFTVLCVSAFITAFYMFRLFFLTFLGKEGAKSGHAHESPLSITGPLWVLAGCSLLAGLPGSPFMGMWLQNFLSGTRHGAHEPQAALMMISTALGAAGIAFAALFYLAVPGLAKTAEAVLRPAGSGLEKSMNSVASGIGTLFMKAGSFQNFFDKYFVDGIVNLSGYAAQLAASSIRRIQTGLVQHSLLVAFAVLMVFLYCGMK